MDALMFVDTSAIVAILCDEPLAGELSDRLEATAAPFTSPLVRLEACMVLASRLRCEPLVAQSALDRLLAAARISVRPITDEIGAIAVDAFERYGKGRGKRARLNLADCMSYACAKAYGEPILFVGRDFGHTDLRAA